MRWYDLSKLGFELYARYNDKFEQYFFVLKQISEDSYSENFVEQLPEKGFKKLSFGYAAPFSQERAIFISNFPGAELIKVNPKDIGYTVKVKTKQNNGEEDGSQKPEQEGDSSESAGEAIRGSGTSREEQPDEKFSKQEDGGTVAENSESAETSISGEPSESESEFHGTGAGDQLDEQGGETYGDEEHNKRKPKREIVNPNHYFLSDDLLKRTTKTFIEKERANENIEAIKVLSSLKEEDRLPNEDEKEVLAKYNGWGGLSSLLHWSNFRKHEWQIELKDQIKKILSSDEYSSALENSPTSFFTPPELITSLWESIEDSGFRGGRILEPSLGIGSFLGLAPKEIVENSTFFGTEVEITSAKIAQNLYPDAYIYNKKFEQSGFPQNFFDLAISNVPFGNYSVYDTEYGKMFPSIHDYFILKSLDKLKPGGICAFITSSYTLDKENDNFRKKIADRGELLGAIRLPIDAHTAQSSVSVTTDLLFLRKRDKPVSKMEGYPDWVTTKGVTYPNKNDAEESLTIPTNNYFVNNPDNVLGKIFINPYRETLEVVNKDDIDIAKTVSQKAKYFLQSIRGKDLKNEDYPEMTLESNDNELLLYRNDEITEDFKYLCVGSFYVQEDDSGELQIFRKTGDNSSELINPKNQKAFERLSGMIGLRDCMNDVLQKQKESFNDTQEYFDAREKLNIDYDAFVKEFGELNKSVNMNLFRDDPTFGRLMALENYNFEKEEAEKADIFYKRIIVSPKNQVKVDNIYEGLLVSLNHYGDIDFDFISDLSGERSEDIMQELWDHGEIYHNPETQKWETKESYLSGHVRKKIKQAKEFAEYDNSYKKNIEALEEVKPQDLTPGDIEVKLGMPWIYSEVVKDFVDKYLNNSMSFFSSDQIEVYRRESDGMWQVKVPTHLRQSVVSTEEMGTNRRPFPELVKNALNQQRPLVYDTVEDEEGNKKQVFNFQDTVAAQEKLDLIQEKFRQFVWEDDPNRAESLLENYNYSYNSFVPPVYSGEHLTFPGMSNHFKPRGYQKDAVWRNLQGNTLIAHEVGLGKTFIQVASAMEMKRLRLANKPLMVVPNSMLEQINREVREIYPDSNVLIVTGKDLQKANRKKFLGKVVNNDWDIVVLTHSMLEKIQIPPEFERALLQHEIFKFKSELEDMSSDERRLTEKQMAKRIKNLEAKLESLKGEKKDEGLYIDDLGIDAIFLDEAHNYKNLQIVSGNTQLNSAINGSSKAWDLYMKTQWLYDYRREEYGVIFSTGTPVTNNAFEIYNMQRYLQPSVLEEANIEHAVSWAANFLSQKTSWEPSHSGQGWKQRTRYILHNLPELMRFFGNCMDIKKSADVGIKLPEVQKNNVVSPVSDLQRKWMKQLDKDLKNGEHVFSVMHKGRHLALDPRTLDKSAEIEEGAKINYVQNNILKKWEDSHHSNGVQLVFCDLSTPKNNEIFNVYHELRDQLIEKGIPCEQIAFIHDYNTPQAKDKLFSQVKSGQIRVLLGSTGKMGEGLNIQDKVVGLHHLDAPWTPAKVQQRNGRIVRFGNPNDNVEIFIYTTEDTFDLFQWNLLRLKEEQFAQVMKGDINIRKFDLEIDPTYAETAAVTSGNPLIREKLEVDQRISELESLAKSHSETVYNLKRKMNSLEGKIENEKMKLNKFSKIPDVSNLSDEEKMWTLKTSNYGFQKDFVGSRKDMLPILKKLVDSQQLTSVPDIEFAGIPISFERAWDAEKCQMNDEWCINIKDNEIFQKDAYKIQRLICEKESILTQAQNSIQSTQKEFENAQEIIGKGFEHEIELHGLYQKRKELENRIEKNSEKSDDEEDDDFQEDKAKSLNDEDKIYGKVASSPA